MFIFSGASFAKDNTIYVNNGHPQFTIKLDSNRTTGYSWSLKNYDKKMILLVSHTYIKPNTKLIGAPGYEKWIFQANPAFMKGTKNTTISLSYARPWEHGKSIKTVVYKIVSEKH